MKFGMRVLGVVLLAALLVGMSASVAVAASQLPVDLGKTATYGLFARGQFITSKPDATCNGDAGMLEIAQRQDLEVGPQAYPITGVNVNGSIHVNDSEAASVAVDLDAAYADAWSRTPFTPVMAPIGNGQTLYPGVYEDGDFNTLVVTGTVTLDAQGDPEAVFIFRTRDRLITIAGSRIVLANGARFCRVFWVTPTADLGPNSTFVGHLISEGDIVVGAGAFVNGQLLAGAGPEHDGDIQLNGNTITNGPCTPRLPKTGYAPAPVRADLPIALCAIAAMALVLVTLRRRVSEI